MTAASPTGMQPAVALSSGWSSYNTGFSTGDLTGDGRADLVVRTSGKVSYGEAG